MSLKQWKISFYTKDKTEPQHIWLLQKAHALSHFQNYENAQSLVCNGCWSVNILVAAETVVSRKKAPSNIPPKLWLYVCLWKIGERVLDQESFIALFHSHLYKFIDIYILEGGMNSSERMPTVRGGCLSKKKTCPGRNGWRSSLLTGKGVSKFIDLYILEGGMTSSERMLIGRGVIGAKKNLPWEGKDRKALTWLGGEFFSKFWKVGWLLKQEGSGGVVGAKKNLPWEGKDREALFWLGEEFINLLISILNLQKECSRGRGLLEQKELTLGRGRMDKLMGKGVVGAKKLTLGGEGRRSSVLTGGGVSTATSWGTWHVQHLQIIVFSVTACDSLFSFVLFKNLL